jgi:hypothetical protein
MASQVVFQDPVYGQSSRVPGSYLWQVVFQGPQSVLSSRDQMSLSISRQSSKDFVLKGSESTGVFESSLVRKGSKNNSTVVFLHYFLSRKCPLAICTTISPQ